ncbi:Epoxide hydrolase 4 [Mactra antiquata]
MANVALIIQILVANVLGYAIATFVMLRLLITSLFKPIKFVKSTFINNRKVMPKCLNDPSLGNHGFLQLEDVKIHYVACGDEGKPLMLCLHGFPEFWFSWRYQMLEFKKDYRVVAVDMRGYGESDKPSNKQDYAYNKLSGDVKQMVEALGYSSCTLMSHDWGGAVAWQVVSQYPEIIDQLVVCNCPHPGTFQKYLRTSWTQMKKSWYMYFFQVPFVPELVFRSNDLVFFDRLMGSIKNTKQTQEVVEAYKYVYSKPGALRGPINYYRAAFSSMNRPNPKMVDVPTLVVWGDPDMALNTELAYLAKKYVSNLTVKVIKNSNHFVMLDRPAEVNAAVREFLQKK